MILEDRNRQSHKYDQESLEAASERARKREGGGFQTMGMHSDQSARLLAVLQSNAKEMRQIGCNNKAGEVIGRLSKINTAPHE